MELRIDRSRATKDVDLGFRDISLRLKKPKKQADELLERLRNLMEQDLSDYFQFRISEPAHSLTGAPFGGARFPVEALIGGKTFSKFHVDVAIGETILEPLDQLIGKDWLLFAGIAPKAYPTITKEQQFAEKIHAYTRPREKGTRSRVRDLVDLVLLISLGTMEKKGVLGSLDLVFKEHPTHSVPSTLPPPPEDWAEPFSALMTECGLDFDLSTAVQIVAKYYSGL